VIALVVMALFFLPRFLKAGITTVYVPPSNSTEALLAEGMTVYAPKTLKELVAHLEGKIVLPKEERDDALPSQPPSVDFKDVKGQESAKRALIIAAAGRHNIVLYGPPGTGKTMLADRLPGLLPDLDDATAFDATRVHSAAGEPLVGGLVRRPPLRAPHHGMSAVAMVGGGTHRVRPGEISLAHGGVLFLDEMGEFGAVVLDSLRQPLEEGVIRLARAEARVQLPARFLLVGAMNPCPCGEGVVPAACRCSSAATATRGRAARGSQWKGEGTPSRAGTMCSFTVITAVHMNMI